MKKLAFIVFMLFLSKIAFAQKQGMHEYSGTIAGKYPITMQLEVSFDSRYATYSGTCYYNNVGKRIQLSGGFDSQGMNGANPDAEDYISEFSDGKNTGAFIFRRSSIGKQQLNGFWESPQGKRMSVSLRKVY
ncbi:MAG: hypothetical protein ACK40K_04905 [Raineya sp.]